LLGDLLDDGTLVHVLPTVLGAQIRLAVVYVEREFLPPHVRAFVSESSVRIRSVATDTIVSRSIAGGGLALSLVVGAWVASRLTLDITAAIETTMARRISPKQAQRQALELEASYASSGALYQTRIDDAVAEHGVAAPSLEQLLAPNTFFHAASHSDPKFLAVGASMREGGISLRVRTEVIETERRGMRTKTEHTLVDIQNVGTKPLAYFVDLRAREKECQVRALTRFDAMALLPGEKGEISICAGSHEVEVRDFRIMEVTEVGALWVSKVPAQAVGYDEVVARSHFAGPGIEVCAELPAAEFANRIKAGEVAWEDLVDFYSRHDCEHYRWWPGYERILEPLAQLPVIKF
jgi:hypothetical protein